MTVRDLIRAGGTLTDAAYGGQAELTRYKVVDGESRADRAHSRSISPRCCVATPKANIKLQGLR